MSDQTKGLRFDIYERLNIPDDVPGIGQLEDIELIPRITMQTEQEQAVLSGDLLLIGTYVGVDERNEASGVKQLNHRIPVEITLPLKRIKRMDSIGIEIENFDVELMSARSLNITGVISLKGIDTSAEQSWRQQGEAVFVHEAAPGIGAGASKAGQPFMAEGFAKVDRSSRDARTSMEVGESEARESEVRESDESSDHTSEAAENRAVAEERPSADLAIPNTDHGETDSASPDSREEATKEKSQEATIEAVQEATLDARAETVQGATQVSTQVSTQEATQEVTQEVTQGVVQEVQEEEEVQQEIRQENEQKQQISTQSDEKQSIPAEAIDPMKSGQISAQQTETVPDTTSDTALSSDATSDASPDSAKVAASDSANADYQGDITQHDTVDTMTKSKEMKIAIGSNKQSGDSWSNAASGFKSLIGISSRQSGESESGQSREGDDSAALEPQAGSASESDASNDARPETDAAHETDGSADGQTEGREDDAVKWKNLLLSSEDDEHRFSKMKMCIVQKEETIDTIASRYSLNPKEIMLYNRLSSEQLEEGQVIYIPV